MILDEREVELLLKIDFPGGIKPPFWPPETACAAKICHWTVVLVGRWKSGLGPFTEVAARGFCFRTSQDRILQVLGLAAQLQRYLTEAAPATRRITIMCP